MESAAKKTIENDNIILSIKDVNKTFPGVKALDNVSLEVRAGTVHGVVGENGAGKSTLMKILSGVYEKDSGTVAFDGQTIEHTTPIESLNRGLSIIYQEFNLVNTMSVGENIFLGRFKEMGGMRGTHAKARELLDSIGSTISTHRFVEELSAAEKQMVEITKALSFNSKLIIMDEPSSSLTSDELKRLFKIIHDLKERGVSIIYISHKLDEIFELCDIVTIMRDGHMIDTKPVSEVTRNEMITKMVGRDIENEYPPRAHCAGDTILTVRSINTRKLHDISFELKKGEILGLVGLVGAGRTEIIRAICGADKVKGHAVTINGKAKNRRSAHHLAKPVSWLSTAPVPLTGKICQVTANRLMAIRPKMNWGKLYPTMVTTWMDWSVKRPFRVAQRMPKGTVIKKVKKSPNRFSWMVFCMGAATICRTGSLCCTE